MPIQTSLREPALDVRAGAADLPRALRLIVLARLMDARMTNLLKQGKSFFHISGAGHEAAQVAFGLAFRAGLDWAFPYYRDLAFMLAIGTSPRDVFLHALAKRDDPMSGGRQMSCHWGSKELNVPSQSSPTGSQFLQAVGVARARRGQGPAVYVSGGEGSTSQGEFHEAVNWASRDRLPVVFAIQNNQWAISVPVEDQSGGKNASVAEMMKGYDRLTRLVVDGTDYPAVQAAAVEAFDLARTGNGPVLVEARCVRLSSHSSSDDQKKYRSQESIARDRERDPLELLSDLALRGGRLDPAGWEELRRQTALEVDEAADWALAQPDPDAETAAAHVLDESGTADRLAYDLEAPTGEPVVMVDAINHALAEELKRNEHLRVFGEDVADGKGGVFTATRGLSTRFGPERVFNSPLAEASIVGVAIGMALAGLKPCVEIQFGDYIWPAFQQIRDELVMYRYRSNNRFSAPVVLRVPVGGFIHGGPYHSQNIEAFFAHMPGLLIAFPSNAADAKGLLKTALRLDDPVLFLEHKALYRQSHAMRPEPGPDGLIPFGRAAVVTKGRDLSVVSWGAMVHECLLAARRLEAEGHSIELIDLRTIVPLDEAALFASVRKTGKVLLVHEDTLSGGFGAELAARIADSCFEHLDGPPRRVGALDAPVPFHSALENFILPSAGRIEQGMRDLLAW